MFSYTFEQWLLMFYIYCFLGWCFESSYVSLKSRHWVNRGFMRGPYLPLYGSGAILMLVVSKPFVDNLWLTYLAGCVAATLLELVTGVVMEHLFKVRYWDYSYLRFQFKGYICLTSTLAWGFLTILMTKVLHKPVEALVLGMPEQLMNVIVLVWTVVMTWDFALSFKAALDLKNILIKLEDAKKELEELHERFKDMVEQANEQLQVAADERSIRLENLKEEIADVRENIQAGLTANFEVRISRLREFENKIDSLDDIKEEYKQWRRTFYENQKKRVQALNFNDKFKRHHLFSNPTMRSEQFSDMIEEIKKYIRDMDNDDKK